MFDSVFDDSACFNWSFVYSDDVSLILVKSTVAIFLSIFANALFICSKRDGICISSYTVFLFFH